jgi:hypothetical protein
MKPSRSQNEQEQSKQESDRREGERPREPFLRNAQSLPNRHRPRSGVLLYPNQPTIVLLNVCTHQRNPWLAQRAVHEALKQVWGEACAWLVGRYVLMPDHLHLFWCA